MLFFFKKNAFPPFDGDSYANLLPPLRMPL